MRGSAGKPLFITVVHGINRPRSRRLCTAGLAAPRTAPLGEENCDDRRVLQEVTTGQPPRLAVEAMEPFESEMPQQPGRPRLHTCKEIERRADAETIAARTPAAGDGGGIRSTVQSA
jgi:hypothetical protein